MTHGGKPAEHYQPEQDKTIWGWKDIEKALKIPAKNKIKELGNAIANRHFKGVYPEKNDVVGYIRDIAALDLPVEQKLILALYQWNFLMILVRHTQNRNMQKHASQVAQRERDRVLTSLIDHFKSFEDQKRFAYSAADMAEYVENFMKREAIRQQQVERE